MRVIILGVITAVKNICHSFLPCHSSDENLSSEIDICFGRCKEENPPPSCREHLQKKDFAQDGSRGGKGYIPPPQLL